MKRRLRSSRVLNAAILGLVSLIGVASFLSPFFVPPTQAGSMSGATAHAQDAPLLTMTLIALSLGAVMGNLLSGGGLNSKMVAALGLLVAVNAILRVVPGPAGFSAIFALPILGGYCYGATFGYLLGALSLVVSALLGGGVGPWLPYQMFTMGWVGLTSAWLPRWPHRPRLEVLMLSLWGMAWGVAFGLIMNVWFWPFIFDAGQSGIYWQPGLGVWEGLRRYLAFYLLTSSWWDLGRAGGNALLLLLFGGPILRLLRRFGRRFTFVQSEQNF